MKRFLAWCPNDCDREGAKDMGYGAWAARDAALEFARCSYRKEAFEKYIDVTVIEVSNDGTEATHEFTVDVEHEPVFRARPR